MLDQFKQHIKKIVPSGSKLLVAVSGGVDSIVLFHLKMHWVDLMDHTLWSPAIGSLL